MVGHLIETEAMSTVSTSVAKLRRIPSDNKGKDNIYGKAFDGSIPLIIHAENKYDIMQLIKIKQDYRKVNFVIYGGSGAPQISFHCRALNIQFSLVSDSV